ncbi:MAG: hypothetical protein RR051_07585, partial [Clostridiales bacterium]
TGQHISRVNYPVIVSDSRNLISFLFTFSAEWVGINKTAIITTGGAAYKCLIVNDMAMDMPVLAAGPCLISVFGGDLYTADSCEFEIKASGLKDGRTPIPSPPDIYNQILGVATDAKDKAVNAESLAKDDQNTASTNAKAAMDAAARAQLESQNASLSAANAKASEANSKASEVTANKEADRATNNILNGVSAHNSDAISHPAIQNHLSDVEKIAKDAKSTITFDDYNSLITAFNTMPKDKYYVGKGMNIVKIGVPDLWIAYVAASSLPYTYTTDDAFETTMRTSGTVQVGFYKIAMMETGKVDLSDYYNKVQVDHLLPKQIAQSVYNAQHSAGTLPVGTYFIRLGV